MRSLLLCVFASVFGVVTLAAQSQPAARDAQPISPAVEWVTREVKAPRVSFHTFESAAAEAKVSYHLYTPAAYANAANKDRRFHVVYWLHGSGGRLAGIPQVARHFDEAIEAGKLPPCLVVFVNGLVEGMYVDWKDGTVPLETVIVRDLVPHIDATHRTIATREGRLLDGFSMGGYGVARLGFKLPEMFRAVSIVGAGPMQEELVQAPRAGRQRAAEVLSKDYGGDQAYFRSVSPRTLAAQNAKAIAAGSLVRVVIGDRDETFENNRLFHEHLESLKLPHTWTVLPGVGHDPMAVLRAIGDDNWAFYRAAFERNETRSHPEAFIETSHTLHVDGRERSFLVQAPQKPLGPLPVVFMFHGGGGRGENLAATGFREMVAREKFIAVYPSGWNNHWNDGRNAPRIEAQQEGVDDVKFVRAVVEEIAERHSIDRRRVFATGVSNGGIFCHYLAANASDLFAGVAPVIGGLAEPVAARFKPSHPISLLVIQGDADPLVPIAGGPIARNDRGGRVISTEHALQLYLERNGVVGEPTEERMPDDDLDDGCRTLVRRYPAGENGVKVEYWLVQGGGHTMPGSRRAKTALKETIVGRMSHDYDGLEVIWEFFETCPPRELLPGETGGAASRLHGKEAARAELDPEVLAKLDTELQRAVARKEVSGVIGLIHRNGHRGYFEAFGWQDIEEQKPLPKDAIFRLQSMSKPVVAACAMTLYDDGLLTLDEPISELCPEWAEPKVLENGQLVPARHPITPRMLMSHSSGLYYGDLEKGPLIGGTASRIDRTNLEAYSKSLATKPLRFHPGEGYSYGTSIDVLGRYIEAVSGKPLDEVMQERILGPLRMTSTDFWVHPENAARICQIYKQPQPGVLERGREASQLTVEPTRFLGGQGLCSSTEDYERFCRMMLNRGELDGVRVLKPETVDLLFQNHLNPKLGQKYGLGGAVDGEGGYAWGGANGTQFWLDRTNQIFGIFMVQTQRYRAPTYGVFKQLANEAAGIASNGRVDALGQGRGGGITNLFKQRDRNNDRKLGPDEIPATLFGRLDGNKDGFVTEVEAKTLWRIKRSESER